MPLGGWVQKAPENFLTQSAIKEVITKGKKDRTISSATH
jgi:hypothetical protein